MKKRKRLDINFPRIYHLLQFQLQTMNSKKICLLQKEIEIIPNRLFFLATSKTTKYQNQSFIQFNVDNMLKYDPFHHDFGPLKISCVFQYVQQLTEITNDPTNRKKKFLHITSIDPKKYSNSIFLICCYSMLSLQKTPEQAFQPFKNFKIIGFRDSSLSNSQFQVTILDCLKGLNRAIKAGWFNMENFSIDDYEYYESTENGDISQIIPKKLYAFSAPSGLTRDRLGKKNLTCHDLAKILKNLGISTVIHLQKADEFSKALQKQKIKSHCLFFPDFTAPETELTQRFLKLMEKNEQQKIAINCKTGLGKAGTMIACYLIKKYNFPGCESISWIRLCRPGSVVGHQQQYLMQFERRCLKQERQNMLTESPERSLKIMRRNSQNTDSSGKQSQVIKTSQKRRGLNRLSSLRPEMMMPQQAEEGKFEPLSATVGRQYEKSSHRKKIGGFNIDDFLDEIRRK